MKNRYKKQSKNYIRNLFKKISKSKGYKYIIQWHFMIRIFLGVLIITYWIIALVVPFLPAAIISIILWALLISSRIKYVRSKFLYIINYLRIKIFFLRVYEKYKILKIIFFKK